MNLSDLRDKVRHIEDIADREVYAIMGHRMAGRTTALSSLAKRADDGFIDFLYVGITAAAALVGARMAEMHSGVLRRSFTGVGSLALARRGSRPRVLLIDDWDTYRNQDRLVVTDFWGMTRPLITVVTLYPPIPITDKLVYAPAKFSRWNAEIDDEEPPKWMYEVEPIIDDVSL